MEELARMQQFIDPPAQKVVYLENAQSGTVAMNKKYEQEVIKDMPPCRKPQSTKRLLWLLRALILWVVVIFLRLVWLQVLQHDDLLRQAQSQQQKMVPIQAQRGSILDRSGQPLAKSLPAESVLVNPKRIKDAAVAANLLAPILGLDARQLREKIQTAIAPRAGIPVGEAQSDGQRSGARSQLPPGIRGISARNAPLLSSRTAGGARSGFGGHRQSDRYD